jgi:predicted nucleic acid-binding protein
VIRRFLLDASIALAWTLDNPIPQFAADVKQELLAGGRATVPAVWHLEIANGLAMAERRRDLSRTDSESALFVIQGIAAQSIETDTTLVSASAALATARAFELTAYDAVYLEIARRDALPLATLDKGLRAAAAKAGVALLK